MLAMLQRYYTRPSTNVCSRESKHQDAKLNGANEQQVQFVRPFRCKVWYSHLKAHEAHCISPCRIIHYASFWHCIFLYLPG